MRYDAQECLKSEANGVLLFERERGMSSNDHVILLLAWIDDARRTGHEEARRQELKGASKGLDQRERLLLVCIHDHVVSLIIGENSKHLAKMLDILHE